MKISAPEGGDFLDGVHNCWVFGVLFFGSSISRMIGVMVSCLMSNV